jgi:hypothetical protein
VRNDPRFVLSLSSFTLLSSLPSIKHDSGTLGCTSTYGFVMNPNDPRL